MNKIIDEARNQYGESPKQIAREMGNALAESESFQLFCYWSECVKGNCLEELENALEQYFINEEWREYQKKHTV